MTERDESKLEGRIRIVFMEELSLASADAASFEIKSRRSRPPRHAGRALWAPLGGVVAIAAVVAGLVLAQAREAAVSGPSPSSTQSAAASLTVLPTATVPPSLSTATPTTADATLRYDDGIPKVWDGQPVIRWDRALAMRATAKDATPVLVGAWLNVPVGVFSCPNDPGPDPSAPDSWVRRGGCQFNYVSADAGATPTPQSGVTTFRFYQGNLATGPAIMRIHIHDPRATECGHQRSICDDMIVVDDVLWTGDAATAPHPLTVADVIAATRAASPASGLRAPASDVWGCGASATDGLMMCPPMTPGVQYASPIAGAAVLPSSEALTRALPTLQPGVAGAVQPSAVDWTEGGSFGSWDYRRLVVDNVMILVRTSVGHPSGSDVQFLQMLVAALKSQEAASGTAP